VIIVQKYGGTSVGNTDRIKNVVDKIIKTKTDDINLVVVVSAMSGETNKLTKYANIFSDNPNKRDMDMLLSSGERVTSALISIALNAKNYKAVSLSGRQAGILTNDIHTKAKIETINTKVIEEKLKSGHIVVVAGFQGVNSNNCTTTLGRGGSDLSAVAIAGSLNADICEIYTDVDGIYTTDPRIMSNAKKIDTISYDEMLELSSLGAKVLQSRSVEMAKKLNVNLCTKSSFNDGEGTMIIKENDNMEKPIVRAIALDKGEARISMIGVKDKPGIASELFGLLHDENINVDMIVQTVGHDNKTNIDFTITKEELNQSKKALKKYENVFDKIEYDENIAKVSIVGVGMKSHSGVASKAFKALAKENINIMMISTSEIKISLLVKDKHAHQSVIALHNVYELEK